MLGLSAVGPPEPAVPPEDVQHLALACHAFHAARPRAVEAVVVVVVVVGVTVVVLSGNVQTRLAVALLDPARPEEVAEVEPVV